MNLSPPVLSFRHTGRGKWLHQWMRCFQVTNFNCLSEETPVNGPCLPLLEAGAQAGHGQRTRCHAVLGAAGSPLSQRQPHGKGSAT